MYELKNEKRHIKLGAFLTAEWEDIPVTHYTDAPEHLWNETINTLYYRNLYTFDKWVTSERFDSYYPAI